MAIPANECPVCKLVGVPSFRDETHQVDCLRCGSFVVTRSFLVELPNLRGADRELLPYLSAYTKQSLETPTVNHANWRDFARSHRATRVPDKADKLLDLCAKRTNIAGEPFKVNVALDYPLVDAVAQSEMHYLFVYLAKSGYIEPESQVLLDTPIAWVTVKGWKKLETPVGGVPGRCFVAMSFDPSLNDAYEQGIKPAIMTNCKLPEPIRMDREQHNEKICDKILADIRTCQFMVADFTLQRAGVYFEAGFAMGLGRPVIWACREDDFDNLHFDTRQYNHIRWSTPADLCKQLTYRVGATILK